MAKIFGLLVGINDYPVNVGGLEGCVNDIEAFEDFLRTEFAPDDLELKVLKNAHAKRENVIGGFRQHLAKAGKDDVALFVYCGHGARWASAPEFHRFYPERMDEGLVCFDSREPGGFDLADKELAVLLSEVAAEEPHLAVVFDCCHSGSGTRGVPDALTRRARQTHTESEPRPLESYLNGHFADLVKKDDFAIPRSRHVLLAACERFQQSFEDYDLEGLPRGIFSTVLLELLQGEGRGLSYQELFNRCRREVHKKDDRMLPQFDSFGGFDSTLGFLGGEATGFRRQFRVFLDGERWKLEAGSLEGMPTEPGVKVELNLYRESGEREMIGGAKTRSVGPRSSTLELDFDPVEGEDTGFIGEVTSMPRPGLRVLATGDANGLEAVEAALVKKPEIELTDDGTGIDYEIRCETDRLELWDLINGRLIQGVKGVDEDSVDYFLTKIVARVAAWERGVALQNRGTRMPMSDVDFWLTHGEDDAVSSATDAEQGDAFAPGSITIDIPPPKSGERAKPVPYKLWVRNKSAQELHCALFYCSPEYGIEKRVNVSVPPGEAQELNRRGLALAKDVAQESLVFKLIVSTEKFDDGLLEVKGFDAERLGRLVTPVTSRGDVSLDEREIFTNEWFAKSVEVRLVHRGALSGRQEVALAGGAITVRPHSRLTAHAGVSSAASNSRAAGGNTLLGQLLTSSRAAGQAFELVDLGGGARGVDAHSVLELSDIMHAEALAEEPLEIVLDAKLRDGEHVLPLVFDGRHVLLGGSPSRLDDGKTLVEIDHLPEVPNDRRSLAKALKLYFVKTFVEPTGVNQLCWVEYGAAGSATRHTEGVAEQVAQAQRVLVVIHGIIGDTEGAAKGVHKAGVDSHFDRVLTYDYENLSTPIEQTAADFVAQLTAAGLGPDDGKHLTILAHSMGGLVSRVFIERLGGGQVVDHLVMCGTPNGGSPYGKLDSARRITTTLTTLLLNYVPAMAPLSLPLLFLLNRSKKITPTLEQMKPGSPFLTELNESSPEVATRYSLLAGNVADYESESAAGLTGLLTKVAQGQTLEVLFGTPAHDIAASVESVLSATPAGEGGETVPCLHTNYFSAPGGLAVLGRVDW